MAESTSSSNWAAWVNHQPPGPEALHIQGIVDAPHPGHTATLTPAIPPGINPDILLMNLTLKALPGIWIQVITSIPVIYVDHKYSGKYKSVNIIHDGNLIAAIDILHVH
jgi:hypothetical protein